MVDNDSTDDMVFFVGQLFSAITLIALQENLDIGRACNMGLQLQADLLLCY